MVFEDKSKKFSKLKCDEKHAIEYQMTIRAMKKNLKIKEFPTIENNRIAGISQAPSIQTGITFIRCLLKEIIIGKIFKLYCSSTHSFKNYY